MINGEKSAFNNSVFGKRRKRTIEAILTSLYKTYDKETSKVIYRNKQTWIKMVKYKLKIIK